MRRTLFTANDDTYDGIEWVT